MAIFTIYSGEMLYALYEEDRNSNGMIDLTSIPKKYGIEGPSGWVWDFAESHQDVLTLNSNPPPTYPSPISGRINGKGRLAVEKENLTHDSVPILIQPKRVSKIPLPTKLGAIELENRSSEGRVDDIPPAGSHANEADVASSVHDSLQGHTSSSPAINSRQSVVDSSAWTGKQFKLVDAKIIAEVKKSAEQLRDVVHATRFESNSDSQNLKCLADALVAVCSMAEPEVTIIERILASPKFQAYAGLATLIATIRGVLGI
jgi:hypothetical protein